MATIIFINVYLRTVYSNTHAKFIVSKYYNSRDLHVHTDTQAWKKNSLCLQKVRSTLKRYGYQGYLFHPSHNQTFSVFYFFDHIYLDFCIVIIRFHLFKVWFLRS